MKTKTKVFLGYDPREIAAYLVAANSMMRHSSVDIGLPRPVVLEQLRRSGIYTRPTEFRDGRLYDVISEHPMATEFAVSRFLVPGLAHSGWSLFADCDVLFRKNLKEELFDKYNDPRYAVYCVKHNHQPTNTEKMIGQVQSRYNCKNWSSVCLWNCDHPSNKKLTLEMINSLPGRDLHAFCWLEDHEIGTLPFEFNYLVGTTPPDLLTTDPAIVHFTEGTPLMPGYETCAYSSEWFEELHRVTPQLLSAFGSLPS